NDRARQLEPLPPDSGPNRRPRAFLHDRGRLALLICTAAIAAISLIGVDRIWLKAHIGIDLSEVPLSATPCETPILGDTVYQGRDARKDPDFAPEGIIIGGHALRFYAGAPLTTPTGVSIGALFVLDVPARA